MRTLSAVISGRPAPGRLTFQRRDPAAQACLGLLLRLTRDFDATLDTLRIDGDFVTDYALEARNTDQAEAIQFENEAERS